ncbi:MAG TPA: KpsF/GutQ family sugar-phosphate isomerase [Pyrinomonadaceae bacterium]|nr:KpsF/GutQ family sugar-phosphate isomerase [Pyrinomonadaceae bacterium]
MTAHFPKVIELLKLEASAIQLAAERLDEASVARAIDLISDCEGKVVVLGVGKSGVIAQKIAQTLTSTGTVSVFVHPSDALHGSLGMITKGDVVIALSNSGETDEIIALLPALIDREVSLISIVGNTDSTLARKSEVVLDASVDKEACPLNLAPTTSTTVALAIGDAIAMTIMECRGLTAEDFAANHPAGRLGKRLTMRVRDLMHESPNIEPGAGWIEVVKAISKYALGAVNVVDGGGRLVGIVTDGDLRRTIERTAADELGMLTAEQMMTSQPIDASPDMLAFDALQLMENRSSQISVLPVVDGDSKCVGLLRLHDIVRSGL